MKSIPQEMNKEGNILFFYITQTGDCMFGVNNREEGILFSGLNFYHTVYPVFDVYGSTVAVELVGMLTYIIHCHNYVM